MSCPSNSVQHKKHLSWAQPCAEPSGQRAGERGGLRGLLVCQAGQELPFVEPAPCPVLTNMCVVLNPDLARFCCHYIAFKG
jgi:hypothetical protein